MFKVVFESEEDKAILAQGLNMGYMFCLNMIKRLEADKEAYNSVYTDEQRTQADLDNISNFDESIAKYQRMMDVLKEWGYSRV
jgi:hypothetical protein